VFSSGLRAFSIRAARSRSSTSCASIANHDNNVRCSTALRMTIRASSSVPRSRSMAVVRASPATRIKISFATDAKS
jgi:hypothetical protein